MSDILDNNIDDLLASMEDGVNQVKEARSSNTEIPDYSLPKPTTDLDLWTGGSNTPSMPGTSGGGSGIPGDTSTSLALDLSGEFNDYSPEDNELDLRYAGNVVSSVHDMISQNGYDVKLEDLYLVYEHVSKKIEGGSNDLAAMNLLDELKNRTSLDIDAMVGDDFIKTLGDYGYVSDDMVQTDYGSGFKDEDEYNEWYNEAYQSINKSPSELPIEGVFISAPSGGSGGMSNYSSSNVIPDNSSMYGPLNKKYKDLKGRVIDSLNEGNYNLKDIYDEWNKSVDEVLENIDTATSARQSLSGFKKYVQRFADAEMLRRGAKSNLDLNHANVGYRAISKTTTELQEKYLAKYGLPSTSEMSKMDQEERDKVIEKLYTGLNKERIKENNPEARQLLKDILVMQRTGQMIANMNTHEEDMIAGNQESFGDEGGLGTFVGEMFSGDSRDQTAAIAKQYNSPIRNVLNYMSSPEAVTNLFGSAIDGMADLLPTSILSDNLGADNIGDRFVNMLGYQTPDQVIESSGTIIRRDENGKPIVDFAAREMLSATMVGVEDEMIYPNSMSKELDMYLFETGFFGKDGRVVNVGGTTVEEMFGDGSLKATIQQGGNEGMWAGKKVIAIGGSSAQEKNEEKANENGMDYSNDSDFTGSKFYVLEDGKMRRPTKSERSTLKSKMQWGSLKKTEETYDPVEGFLSTAKAAYSMAEPSMIDMGTAMILTAPLGGGGILGTAKITRRAKDVSGIGSKLKVAGGNFSKRAYNRLNSYQGQGTAAWFMNSTYLDNLNETYRTYGVTAEGRKAARNMSVFEAFTNVAIGGVETGMMSWTFGSVMSAKKILSNFYSGKIGRKAAFNMFKKEIPELVEENIDELLQFPLKDVSYMLAGADKNSVIDRDKWEGSKDLTYGATFAEIVGTTTFSTLLMSGGRMRGQKKAYNQIKNSLSLNEDSIASLLDKNDIDNIQRLAEEFAVEGNDQRYRDLGNTLAKYQEDYNDQETAEGKKEIARDIAELFQAREELALLSTQTGTDSKTGDHVERRKKAFSTIRGIENSIKRKGNNPREKKHEMNRGKEMVMFSKGQVLSLSSNTSMEGVELNDDGSYTPDGSRSNLQRGRFEVLQDSDSSGRVVVKNLDNQKIYSVNTTTSTNKSGETTYGNATNLDVVRGKEYEAEPEVARRQRSDMSLEIYQDKIKELEAKSDRTKQEEFDLKIYKKKANEVNASMNPNAPVLYEQLEDNDTTFDDDINNGTLSYNNAVAIANKIKEGKDLTDSEVSALETSDSESIANIELAFDDVGVNMDSDTTVMYESGGKKKARSGISFGDVLRLRAMDPAKRIEELEKMGEDNKSTVGVTGKRKKAASNKFQELDDLMGTGLTTFANARKAKNKKGTVKRSEISKSAVESEIDYSHSNQDKRMENSRGFSIRRRNVEITPDGDKKTRGVLDSTNRYESKKNKPDNSLGKDDNQDANAPKSKEDNRKNSLDMKSRFADGEAIYLRESDIPGMHFVLVNGQVIEVEESRIKEVDNIAEQAGIPQEVIDGIEAVIRDYFNIEDPEKARSLRNVMAMTINNIAEVEGIPIEEAWSKFAIEKLKINPRKKIKGLKKKTAKQGLKQLMEDNTFVSYSPVTDDISEGKTIDGWVRKEPDYVDEDGNKREGKFYIVQANSEGNVVIDSGLSGRPFDEIGIMTGDNTVLEEDVVPSIETETKNEGPTVDFNEDSGQFVVTNPDGSQSSYELNENGEFVNSDTTTKEGIPQEIKEELELFATALELANEGKLDGVDQDYVKALALKLGLKPKQDESKRTSEDSEAVRSDWEKEALRRAREERIKQQQEALDEWEEAAKKVEDQRSAELEEENKKDRDDLTKPSDLEGKGTEKVDLRGTEFSDGNGIVAKAEQTPSNYKGGDVAVVVDQSKPQVNTDGKVTGNAEVTVMYFSDLAEGQKYINEITSKSNPKRVERINSKYDDMISELGPKPVVEGPIVEKAPVKSELEDAPKEDFVFGLSEEMDTPENRSTVVKIYDSMGVDPRYLQDTPEDNAIKNRALSIFRNSVSKREITGEVSTKPQDELTINDVANTLTPVKLEGKDVWIFRTKDPTKFSIVPIDRTDSEGKKVTVKIRTYKNPNAKLNDLGFFEGKPSVDETTSPVSEIRYDGDTNKLTFVKKGVTYEFIEASEDSNQDTKIKAKRTDTGKTVMLVKDPVALQTIANAAMENGIGDVSQEVDDAPLTMKDMHEALTSAHAKYMKEAGVKDKGNKAAKSSAALAMHIIETINEKLGLDKNDLSRVSFFTDGSEKAPAYRIGKAKAKKDRKVEINLAKVNADTALPTMAGLFLETAINTNERAKVLKALDVKKLDEAAIKAFQDGFMDYVRTSKAPSTLLGKLYAKFSDAIKSAISLFDAVGATPNRSLVDLYDQMILGIDAAKDRKARYDAVTKVHNKPITRVAGEVLKPSDVVLPKGTTNASEVQLVMPLNVNDENQEVWEANIKLEDGTYFRDIVTVDKVKPITKFTTSTKPSKSKKEQSKERLSDEGQFLADMEKKHGLSKAQLLNPFINLDTTKKENVQDQEDLETLREIKRYSTKGLIKVSDEGVTKKEDGYDYAITVRVSEEDPGNVTIGLVGKSGKGILSTVTLPIDESMLWVFDYKNPPTGVISGLVEANFRDRLDKEAEINRVVTKKSEIQAKSQDQRSVAVVEFKKRETLENSGISTVDGKNIYTDPMNPSIIYVTDGVTENELEFLGAVMDLHVGDVSIEEVFGGMKTATEVARNSSNEAVFKDAVGKLAEMYNIEDYDPVSFSNILRAGLFSSEQMGSMERLKAMKAFIDNSNDALDIHAVAARFGLNQIMWSAANSLFGANEKNASFIDVIKYINKTLIPAMNKKGVETSEIVNGYMSEAIKLVPRIVQDSEGKLVPLVDSTTGERRPTLDLSDDDAGYVRTGLRDKYLEAVKARMGVMGLTPDSDTYKMVIDTIERSGIPMTMSSFAVGLDISNFTAEELGIEPERMDLLDKVQLFQQHSIAYENASRLKSRNKVTTNGARYLEVLGLIDRYMHVVPDSYVRAYRSSGFFLSKEMSAEMDKALKGIDNPSDSDILSALAVIVDGSEQFKEVVSEIVDGFDKDKNTRGKLGVTLNNIVDAAKLEKVQSSSDIDISDSQKEELGSYYNFAVKAQGIIEGLKLLRGNNKSDVAKRRGVLKGLSLNGDMDLYDDNKSTILDLMLVLSSISNKSGSLDGMPSSKLKKFGLPKFNTKDLAAVTGQEFDLLEGETINFENLERRRKAIANNTMSSENSDRVIDFLIDYLTEVNSAVAGLSEAQVADDPSLDKLKKDLENAIGNGMGMDPDSVNVLKQFIGDVNSSDTDVKGKIKEIIQDFVDMNGKTVDSDVEFARSQEIERMSSVKYGDIGTVEEYEGGELVIQTPTGKLEFSNREELESYQSGVDYALNPDTTNVLNLEDGNMLLGYQNGMSMLGVKIEQTSKGIGISNVTGSVLPTSLIDGMGVKRVSTEVEEDTTTQEPEVIETGKNVKEIFEVVSKAADSYKKTRKEDKDKKDREFKEKNGKSIHEALKPLGMLTNEATDQEIRDSFGSEDGDVLVRMMRAGESIGNRVFLMRNDMEYTQEIMDLLMDWGVTTKGNSLARFTSYNNGFATYGYSVSLPIAAVHEFGHGLHNVLEVVSGSDLKRSEEAKAVLNELATQIATLINNGEIVIKKEGIARIHDHLKKYSTLEAPTELIAELYSEMQKGNVDFKFKKDGFLDRLLDFVNGLISSILPDYKGMTKEELISDTSAAKDFVSIMMDVLNSDLLNKEGKLIETLSYVNENINSKLDELESRGEPARFSTNWSTLVDVGPKIVSSINKLYDQEFAEEIKAKDAEVEEDTTTKEEETATQEEGSLTQEEMEEMARQDMKVFRDAKRRLTDAYTRFEATSPREMVKSSVKEMLKLYKNAVSFRADDIKEYIDDVLYVDKVYRKISEDRFKYDGNKDLLNEAVQMINQRKDLFSERFIDFVNNMASMETITRDTIDSLESDFEFPYDSVLYPSVETTPEKMSVVSDDILGKGLKLLDGVGGITLPMSLDGIIPSEYREVMDLINEAKQTKARTTLSMVDRMSLTSYAYEAESKIRKAITDYFYNESNNIFDANTKDRETIKDKGQYYEEAEIIDSLNLYNLSEVIYLSEFLKTYGNSDLSKTVNRLKNRMIKEESLKYFSEKMREALDSLDSKEDTTTQEEIAPKDLKQTRSGKVKGTFQTILNQSGELEKALVKLGPDADATTILHELSHWYLDAVKRNDSKKYKEIKERYGLDKITDKQKKKYAKKYGLKSYDEETVLQELWADSVEAAFLNNTMNTPYMSNDLDEVAELFKAAYKDSKELNGAKSFDDIGELLFGSRYTAATDFGTIKKKYANPKDTRPGRQVSFEAEMVAEGLVRDMIEGDLSESEKQDVANSLGLDYDPATDKFTKKEKQKVKDKKTGKEVTKEVEVEIPASKVLSNLVASKYESMSSLDVKRYADRKMSEYEIPWIVEEHLMAQAALDALVMNKIFEESQGIVKAGSDKDIQTQLNEALSKDGTKIYVGTDGELSYTDSNGDERSWTEIRAKLNKIHPTLAVSLDKMITAYTNMAAATDMKIELDLNPDQMSMERSSFRAQNQAAEEEKSDKRAFERETDRLRRDAFLEEQFQMYQDESGEESRMVFAVNMMNVSNQTSMDMFSSFFAAVGIMNPDGTLNSVVNDIVAKSDLVKTDSEDSADVMREQISTFVAAIKAVGSKGSNDSKFNGIRDVLRKIYGRIFKRKAQVWEIENMAVVFNDEVLKMIDKKNERLNLPGFSTMDSSSKKNPVRVLHVSYNDVSLGAKQVVAAVRAGEAKGIPLSSSLLKDIEKHFGKEARQELESEPSNYKRRNVLDARNWIKGSKTVDDYRFKKAESFILNAENVGMTEEQIMTALEARGMQDVSSLAYFTATGKMVESDYIGQLDIDSDMNRMERLLANISDANFVLRKIERSVAQQMSNFGDDKSIYARAELAAERVTQINEDIARNILGVVSSDNVFSRKKNDARDFRKIDSALFSRMKRDGLLESSNAYAHLRHAPQIVQRYIEAHDVRLSMIGNRLSAIEEALVKHEGSESTVKKLNGLKREMLEQKKKMEERIGVLRQAKENRVNELNNWVENFVEGWNNKGSGRGLEKLNQMRGYLDEFNDKVRLPALQRKANSGRLTKDSYEKLVDGRRTFNMFLKGEKVGKAMLPEIEFNVEASKFDNPMSLSTSHRPQDLLHMGMMDENNELKKGFGNKATEAERQSLIKTLEFFEESISVDMLKANKDTIGDTYKPLESFVTKVILDTNADIKNSLNADIAELVEMNAPGWTIRKGLPLISDKNKLAFTKGGNTYHLTPKKMVNESNGEYKKRVNKKDGLARWIEMENTDQVKSWYEIGLGVRVASSVIRFVIDLQQKVRMTVTQLDVGFSARNAYVDYRATSINRLSKELKDKGIKMGPREYAAMKLDFARATASAYSTEAKYRFGKGGELQQRRRLRERETDSLVQASTEMDMYREEAIKNGMMLTWSKYTRDFSSYIASSNRAKSFEEIEKAIEERDKDKKGVVSLVTTAVDEFGQMAETATRLAAYSVARKYGLTATQAAHIGRSVTINFSRKGSLAKSSVLFKSYLQGNLFMNVAIQGMVYGLHRQYYEPIQDFGKAVKKSRADQSNNLRGVVGDSLDALKDTVIAETVMPMMYATFLGVIGGLLRGVGSDEEEGINRTNKLFMLDRINRLYAPHIGSINSIGFNRVEADLKDLGGDKGVARDFKVNIAKDRGYISRAQSSGWNISRILRSTDENKTQQIMRELSWSYIDGMLTELTMPNEKLGSSAREMLLPSEIYSSGAAIYDISKAFNSSLDSPESDYKYAASRQTELVKLFNKVMTDLGYGDEKQNIVIGKNLEGLFNKLLPMFGTLSKGAATLSYLAIDDSDPYKEGYKSRGMFLDTSESSDQMEILRQAVDNIASAGTNAFTRNMSSGRYTPNNVTLGTGVGSQERTDDLRWAVSMLKNSYNEEGAEGWTVRENSLIDQYFDAFYKTSPDNISPISWFKLLRTSFGNEKAETYIAKYNKYHGRTK